MLRALALYVWLDQLDCAPTDRATFLCISSGGGGDDEGGGNGGSNSNGSREGSSEDEGVSDADPLITAPLVCRLLQQLMSTSDHPLPQSSSQLLIAAMATTTTSREQWHGVLEFIAQHTSSNTLQSFCRNPRYVIYLTYHIASLLFLLVVNFMKAHYLALPTVSHDHVTNIYIHP